MAWGKGGADPSGGGVSHTVRRKVEETAGPWVAGTLEAGVWSACALGIWLLSLSSVGVEELAVGAWCATLCGVTVTLVRRLVGPRWMRVSWAPFADALRVACWLPVSIVTDASLVLLFPWRRRRPEGRFVTVDVGAKGTSPKAATQRALVVALLSTSPGSFAVDTDPDRGSVTIHSLGGGPPRLEDRLSRR